MMRFHSFVSRTILTLAIIISLTLALDVLITINKEHINVYALNETSLADFNFAAAGDWGCTPNSKNTVESIFDKSPELVLGLGDYSYRKDAGCWLQLINPIHDKMKIVLGNHDHLFYTNATKYYSAPEHLQQYLNYFKLKKQFYSFNYQNVHFIAMSTEVPYEHGSKQYNFVKSDLKRTVSNPDIDWVVVFYHRVAYTSPALIGSIPAIRNTYHPLFEKYGVDLVIQAHSHNYQRTYPINFNHNDSLNPFIMEKNTTYYHNPKGQIYTIVGTAGSPDVQNFTGPAAPFTAVQFNAFGFLNINVLHNGTMLEGDFYENNGTIKDHFTIVKSITNNKQTDS
jgi:Calcineurin-like phosphoesterase/Iron/zinc purple acid phosphatase-like protein C